ncbi:MAG: phage tail protein [Lentisphaeria bacterium]|nr:phage tail protein [Lentisphaeria bacterium]
MIKIDVEKNALEKAARMLEGIPGGIQQAMVSAYNRALQEGRTAGTREAVKRYTLPAGIVRQTMAMHRASKGHLEAELVSRGRRLPLTAYKHKPGHDTTGAKRTQVSVSVRKGVLKPIGQGFIYHGMVMQRVGASRLPVTQPHSLSVPNILNNDEIVEVIQQRMAQSVSKRLTHETERILAGYGK